MLTWSDRWTGWCRSSTTDQRGSGPRSGWDVKYLKHLSICDMIWFIPTMISPAKFYAKIFSIFFYNHILFHHQNNDCHLGHILREDGHSESLLSRAGVDLENVYFDESYDTHMYQTGWSFLLFPSMSSSKEKDQRSTNKKLLFTLKMSWNNW